MTTAIIGGGLAGLAAAYKLAENDEVLLIEKEKELGGMLASYSINNYHIEQYYHHLFAGDAALINLINGLGLGGRLEWLRGTTGYCFDGKIYPMTTPLEILKALPLMDVIRLSWLVLKARTIKDTSPFDEISARDWILRTAGESVYNNFFLPLLWSKFGENYERASAAWLLGRVQIRSNRGAKGERLGYLRGGFYALIDAMAESIKKKGGTIRHGNVSKIMVNDGTVTGVIVGSERIKCDRVISTVSPAALRRLIDVRSLGFDINISYQGTACALFGLTEKVMDDVYWLNIRDDVPFGAVVEHTNFIPPSDYGEHLMYVTSYFQSPESTLWRAKDWEVLELYTSGLTKLFPDFRKKIKWWRLRRDIDTAPVYEVGYRRKVLPYETKVGGLYLAGMFSEANYPERSMNGSIAAGFKCADTIIKSEV